MTEPSGNRRVLFVSYTFTSRQGGGVGNARAEFEGPVTHARLKEAEEKIRKEHDWDLVRIMFWNALEE